VDGDAPSGDGAERKGGEPAADAADVDDEARDGADETADVAGDVPGAPPPARSRQPLSNDSGAWLAAAAAAAADAPAS